jgi:hypothetical protein
LACRYRARAVATVWDARQDGVDPCEEEGEGREADGSSKAARSIKAGKKCTMQ